MTADAATIRALTQAVSDLTTVVRELIDELGRDQAPLDAMAARDAVMRADRATRLREEPTDAAPR